MGRLIALCLLAPLAGSSGPAGVSICPILRFSSPAGLWQHFPLQLGGGEDFCGEDAAAGGEAAPVDGKGEIGEELVAQLKGNSGCGTTRGSSHFSK